MRSGVKKREISLKKLLSGLRSPKTVFSELEIDIIKEMFRQSTAGDLL